jgi:hypothetical protein
MSNNGNLQNIFIAGMPQFNCYDLIKNNVNNLLVYGLRDINWIIPASDIVDTADGLKGINAIEIIIQNNVTPRAYDGSATSSARALTGTISFASGVSSVDALAIYEHYSNIYPDLVFNFNEDDIKHINLYDGDGNIYWSKPVAINTIITESFYDSSSYGPFVIPTKTSTQ